MKKKKILEEKKEEEVKEKHDVKKADSQLKWMLIVIFICFAVFLISYFLIRAPSTFEYAGVKWAKIDYSGLDLFASQFPMPGGTYNLYLRTDPRENKIPINATFKFYTNVIVAIEPDAGNCYGASMGQLTLGQFLGAAQRSIEVGLTDKEMAKSMNLIYADCSSAVNKTVILIKKSDSPSIELQENCYIINVGDCENTPAVERFIVGVLADINKKQI